MQQTIQYCRRFSWLMLIGCLAAALVSCKKDSIAPAPAPAVPFRPVAPAPPLKLLALGDSYTIGQSVSVSERFPHQTVERLSQSGIKFAEPEYIAATGWTTQNLLSAINTAGKPKNYDVVTLLIGVNNQYQGRDTGEYRRQFVECLYQAISHANSRKERVFVLSIPDYGVTPFGKSMNPARIAGEIDQFNKINLEITAAAGVRYIEITQGSREAAVNPSLVAADGLHPSGKEYQKWAEKLATEILKALR